MIIQVRRGSAAKWTQENMVLACGEFGYDIDAKRLKIGDGSTEWNALPYVGDVKRHWPSFFSGLTFGITAGAVLAAGIYALLQGLLG
jgi:Major tropism determinant N-terminal domain